MKPCKHLHACVRTVRVPSFDSLDRRLSFTGRLHADGDLICSIRN